MNNLQNNLNPFNIPNNQFNNTNPPHHLTSSNDSSTKTPSNITTYPEISERLRKTRNRKRKNYEINIIPLLDILLVLLVVFMITAENINSNINLSMPEASNQTQQLSQINQDKDLIIQIDQNSQIIFNQDQKFQNIESFQHFLSTNSMLSNYSKNIEKNVILVSDAKIAYQNIVEVLVALNNVGLNKVKMAYKNK